MVRKISLKLALFSLLFTLMLPMALAQDDTVQGASFKSRCANLPEGYPECADSPIECASNAEGLTPFNCIFLQEPIGGRPGYDLFKVDCTESTVGTGKEPVCLYTPYYGEAIVGKTAGPFQAILVYEEGKESQGPFGLLYNYLGLVYNYLSGLIIAFVIFVVIIGGVRISTSGGGTDGYEQGKKWIISALLGMILWFTASVILYTINPTFFAF